MVLVPSRCRPHQHCGIAPARLFTRRTATRYRGEDVTLKDDIKQRGLQLLSDPRVLRLLQSEEFVGAMTALMQLPGRVGDFTAEQSERFARRLGLASAAEVEELRHRVAKLEAALERLREPHERRA